MTSLSKPMRLSILGFVTIAAVACDDDADGRVGLDGSVPAADAAVPVDGSVIPDASRPDDAGDAVDAGVLDGSAFDGGGDAGPSRPAWPQALDVRVDAWFVRKAIPLRAGGVITLVEQPRHLHVGFGLPRRELRWFTATGGLAQSTAPAEGRYLLDVVAHPSDTLTVLFSSDAGYRLWRIRDDGTTLGALDLADPDIDTDPPTLAPGAATGPITAYTRDAGRIAAAGEDVVVGLRTGRQSVVAYRYGFSGDAFVRRSRTLAFPAVSIVPIGLRGGSYDTFGHVDAQYAVHVAVDDLGTAYVGVRYPELSPNRFARAIRDVFGETHDNDPDFLDSWVARIAPDGRRLGTSLIRTDKADELYGLRGAANAAYAVGRNEIWNASGTGFDALVARVDGATGVVTVRDFDVDRSDIAFDAVELPGRGLVVVGASGYVQNPNGASISEESNAFAVLLPQNGPITGLTVPKGPRHNEARFVSLASEHAVVVGGMLDGPGTHSADGDVRLLRAHGFVSRTTVP